MGLGKKAKYTVNRSVGRMKEEAGRATDTPDLAAEGVADQVVASAGLAGERVKDAAKRVRRSLRR
ncbi:MAG TPA: CsbD family protein [Pseudonocardia sp.]|nr:CsbD family protein [Pseudonocardia sp.]